MVSVLGKDRMYWSVPLYEKWAKREFRPPSDGVPPLHQMVGHIINKTNMNN